MTDLNTNHVISHSLNSLLLLINKCMKKVSSLWCLVTNLHLRCSRVSLLLLLILLTPSHIQNRCYSEIICTVNTEIPTWMCLIRLSTEDFFTRVTVHPPKPPPVIREPYTPSTSKASLTSKSSSSQLTS